MIKKSLLLMLLMALLVPWAANAQQTAPYNEGFEAMSDVTDLNTAGWELLSQSSSGFFLAIETTASNVAAGSKSLNIDGWDASSNSSYGFVGLPLISNKAINELQMTFSYKTSGGTNVQIGYLTDANDGSTFVSVEQFSTSSAFTTKTVEFGGVPATAARIAIKYTGYYRCYVDEVEVKQLPNCKTPQNLTASNIKTDRATLTWERNAAGSEDAWIVEYGTTSDFTGATSLNVTGGSPTKTLTGLTENTKYYARVKADCGGEESDPTAAISFTTLCEPTTIPTAGWSENFDSYTHTSNTATTNNLPDCWSYINTTTYSSYQGYPYVYYASSYSHSGNYHLRFYSYYSSWGSYDPQPQYAILPPMDNLTGKQITLWARGYNTSSTFKIGTMTDPSDVTTFTAIAEQTLTTTYTEFTYPLSGTNACVAIMIDAANSSRTTNGVYIDDIIINDAPSCVKPIGLNLVGTAQTATFTWTSDASQWQVAYSKDATADPNDNIVGLVDVKSFTKDNLDLDTDHYFWVRTYCSATEQSEWAGPESVYIGYCVPATTQRDGKGITGVAFGIGSYSVNNVDDNGLPNSSPYYGNYTSMIGAVQSGIESTIAITTSTGNYPYTFVIWVDFDNSLSFEDSEVVYTGKCSSGTGTLNANITIPTTQALGDYRMRVIGADSYFNSFYNSGNINWSANHSTCLTGSTYYVAHDYTLRVLEAPSCLIPTGFNITDNVATWNVGEGTQWNLQYKKTSETTWTAVNGLTAATYTFDLTSLGYGIEYEAQVQTDCGTNGTSDWTASTLFVTPFCDAGDMCQIKFDLTDSYGDTWNGNYLQIVDVATNIVLGTVTNDYDQYTATGSSGTCTVTKYLNVCDGQEIKFEYILGASTGTYPTENSFVIYDLNDDVICEHGTNPTGFEYTYTVDCTVTDCKKPTAFTATEPGPDCVKLSWTENGLATDWIVAYKKSSDTDYKDQVTATTNPYTLTGLDSETAYTVKVRPNCSDAAIKWSDEQTFQTTVACPAPYDLVINPLHESANISWTGYSDTYTVKYRQGASAGSILLEEHFDADDMPTGWEIMGLGTSNWSIAASENAGGTANEANMSWSPDFNGISRLVSPAIDLTGVSKVMVSFKHNLDNYTGSHTLGIATTSDNGTTWNVGWSKSYSTSGTYNVSEEITTSDMGSSDVRFCIYYSGNSYNINDWYFDDIEVAEVVEPGAFLTATGGENITATTFNLTGLTMSTPYEVKIEGHCGSTIVESTVSTFTTLNANDVLFVTEGNWDESSNWIPGIPTSTSQVSIRANVTIPDKCIAYASTIAFVGTPTPTLTIQDGGQLICNSSVTGTIEKNIKAYTSGTRDGYYLLCVPQNSYYYINPTSITGMINGDYDLYHFDGTQVGEEWRNYETSTFNLWLGRAYLYANSANTTLRYTGTLPAKQENLGYINYGTTSSSVSTLNYNDSGTAFESFNLVGNNLPHEAYVYIGTVSGGSVTFASTYYYAMNDNRDEIEPMSSWTPIKPWEGVFVEATATGQNAFITSTNYGSTLQTKSLNITLSHNGKRADLAIIDFGEGNDLSKMQFNSNHSKLYIPQGNKDYAVVHTENAGEIPVNFKAAENGTHTLSFNSENTEFSYLHLIDNMTGNDVDLLANSSYTFDARYTDYASRFKLVFATSNNGNEDNFGFISDGQLVLTGLTGGETLQVVDALGRVIVSTNAMNRVSVDNMAAGVYVLRLINGDNVKTQKIVVK